MRLSWTLAPRSLGLCEACSWCPWTILLWSTNHFLHTSDLTWHHSPPRKAPFLQTPACRSSHRGCTNQRQVWALISQSEASITWTCPRRGWRGHLAWLCTDTSLSPAPWSPLCRRNQPEMDKFIRDNKGQISSIPWPRPESSAALPGQNQSASTEKSECHIILF